MTKHSSLIETLALERIEVNLFRGLSPTDAGPRLSDRNAWRVRRWHEIR